MGVIFAKRADERYVITVYPTKYFEEESKRKVKSGRRVITE